LAAKEKKGLINRLNPFKKKNVGENFTEIPPEEEEEMDDAEQEIAQREAIEYQERQAAPPERDEEVIAKLFEVESRMAVTKGLQRVKDTESGIERDIGIESSDEYPEPFNTDIPKANMKDSEIESCWGHITLMNMLRVTGKSSSFPLHSIAQFNNSQKAALVNLSRGRAGFSAILSRTHKSVSEGVIDHIKKEQKERKAKRWGVI